MALGHGVMVPDATSVKHTASTVYPEGGFSEMLVLMY